MSLLENVGATWAICDFRSFFIEIWCDVLFAMKMMCVHCFPFKLLWFDRKLTHMEYLWFYQCFCHGSTAICVNMWSQSGLVLCYSIFWQINVSLCYRETLYVNISIWWCVSRRNKGVNVTAAIFRPDSHSDINRWGKCSRYWFPVMKGEVTIIRPWHTRDWIGFVAKIHVQRVYHSEQWAMNHNYMKIAINPPITWKFHHCKFFFP